MVKIEFSTENAAFEGAFGAIEIVRILREIANKIAGSAVEGKIKDVNGNNIGDWMVTERGMEV